MDELLKARSGETLTLTLNRPDKMNALSAPWSMRSSTPWERRPATGPGSSCSRAGRNFSAGFDFGGYEDQSEGDLLLRFVRIEQLLQALAHAPFDTLALAHGRNFGAGVDVVCACGRRVGDPAATFRMPGLSFGLVLGTRRYAIASGAPRPGSSCRRAGCSMPRRPCPTVFSPPSRRPSPGPTPSRPRRRRRRGCPPGPALPSTALPPATPARRPRRSRRLGRAPGSQGPHPRLPRGLTRFRPEDAP